MQKLLSSDRLLDAREAGFGSDESHRFSIFYDSTALESYFLGFCLAALDGRLCFTREQKENLGSRTHPVITEIIVCDRVCEDGVHFYSSFQEIGIHDSAFDWVGSYFGCWSALAFDGRPDCSICVLSLMEDDKRKSLRPTGGRMRKLTGAGGVTSPFSAGNLDAGARVNGFPFHATQIIV